MPIIAGGSRAANAGDGSLWRRVFFLARIVNLVVGGRSSNAVCALAHGFAKVPVAEAYGV
jgi:hypothetical protein